MCCIQVFVIGCILVVTVVYNLLLIVYRVSVSGKSVMNYRGEHLETNEVGAENANLLSYNYYIALK